MDAFYTPAYGFFLELRSTFGEQGRTQLDLFKRYLSYQLLVMDEINVRSESAWENNTLHYLIDQRCQRELATLILSNKPREELLMYFKGAIASRVSEQGAIIDCDWCDLRPRHA